MSKIPLKDKTNHTELLKVATFRKDVLVTKPHKHNNYIEVIFLTDGSGEHVIDKVKHTINPPTFFFVRREQVHHWNLSSTPVGFVLIIKNEFIESTLDPEIKNLIAKLSYHSQLRVQETTMITSIFELLVIESKHLVNNNLTIIEGLLKALFSKIIQQARKNNHELVPANGLYLAYIELLSDANKLKNSVAYYANALNTTAQNLNSVCRKNGMMSASEILAEYLMSEAKRQLIYTDNSVSEIAFGLSFNDASHFIKFFKRKTGLTPTKFRVSL